MTEETRAREELARLIEGHKDKDWNLYCLGWFYALKYCLGETEEGKE